MDRWWLTQHTPSCPLTPKHSHNELGDFGRSITSVLARLPSLLSLNLAGNPVVSTPQVGRVGRSDR